ncbi:MAG: hypothetical protein RIB32_03735 [Phycisphaerales bacterium]
MDERQRQVQVGAGLQESRLNTEFIDWLKKWGNRILTVVLVLVAVYAGTKWYERWQDQKVDAAFEEWEAARQYQEGRVQGNPLALIDIANEHEGQASVAELARLDAAGVWLDHASVGLKVGADRQMPSEEDVLTDDELNDYLERAEETYQQVLDATAGKSEKLVLAQAARRGLAAVALSRGGDENFARAETLLQDIVERAEANGGMQDQVAAANAVLARIDTLRVPIRLYPADELPESAKPQPEADPAAGLTPIPGPVQPMTLSPAQPAGEGAEGDEADTDSDAPADSPESSEETPAEQPQSGDG